MFFSLIVLIILNVFYAESAARLERKSFFAFTSFSI